METSNMNMREVMRYVIDVYGTETLTSNLSPLLSDFASHLKIDAKLIRYIVENTEICKIYSDANEKDEQVKANALIIVM